MLFQVFQLFQVVVILFLLRVVNVVFVSCDGFHLLLVAFHVWIDQVTDLLCLVVVSILVHH